MNKIVVPHEISPIAIYDAEKKKLIGIFNSRGLCGIYVFGKVKSIQIHQFFRAKSVSHSNILNLKIAFRSPNPAQIIELGERDFIIYSPYPQPHGNICLKYTDSRRDLALKMSDAGERLKKSGNRKTAVRQDIFYNNEWISIIDLSKKYNITVHAIRYNIRKYSDPIPSDELKLRYKSSGYFVTEENKKVQK